VDSPIVRYRTRTEILAHPVATPLPTLSGTAWQWVRDCCEILIASAIIAYMLLTFVVQPTRVQGISMQPTLHTGQRLVMEKISYLVDAPHQGDIVVIEPEYSATALIKRVIATSGDTVEIKDGVVYVNGQALSPSDYNYYTPGTLRLTEIPQGHVFVLGDNRSHSNDSRAFGTISEDEILGRAVFSYYPLDTFGVVH
jgi:signal peptidase I